MQLSSVRLSAGLQTCAPLNVEDWEQSVVARLKCTSTDFVWLQIWKDEIKWFKKACPTD